MFIITSTPINHSLQLLLPRRPAHNLTPSRHPHHATRAAQVIRRAEQSPHAAVCWIMPVPVLCYK
eukprot:CAMPEP_0185854088 /NCGR_PEP_ID=MMETSP1354-20130828/21287_1 /TAXON_ID=708628 /ORGANISM="Erythrolobus madagascarensis, Strain CCMP3276" /LENGTH=64 /DNA_ID=CAMNT_0028555767 /DNA_START=55 /DNA_END=246 /DNA_ORIENTATION=-